MNRFRAWGLSAALAAGATAPAAAADPPADPPRPPARGTLFGKMFGPKPTTSQKGPSVVPPAPPAPLDPKILADALWAEQEAWSRRVSVCSELRRIGEESQNDLLVREADVLERKATELYNQRVAALGVPKVKAPMPEPSAPAVALDRRLGTGVAVNPLTAPAAPTPLDPGASTAEARPADPGVREVKP